MHSLFKAIRRERRDPQFGPIFGNRIPPISGILLFQSYCKTECICQGMDCCLQRLAIEYSHSLRTEYDHGVSTYSPEGRLFQVEYAIESIKVGVYRVFVII